ncbi:hypothetical protein D3C80_1656730 [compost metagenome]
MPLHQLGQAFEQLATQVKQPPEQCDIDTGGNAYGDQGPEYHVQAAGFPGLGHHLAQILRRALGRLLHRGELQ